MLHSRHGGGTEVRLAEVDLEFLGRQIGVLIEGQREMKARPRCA